MNSLLQEFNEIYSHVRFHMQFSVFAIFTHFERLNETKNAIKRLELKTMRVLGTAVTYIYLMSLDFVSLCNFQCFYLQNELILWKSCGRTASRDLAEFVRSSLSLKRLRIGGYIFLLTIHDVFYSMLADTAKHYQASVTTRSRRVTWGLWDP